MTPRICSAIALIALAAPPAKGRVLVDSQGFESPPFSTTFEGTGRLEGQRGWDATPGAGAGVVQSAVSLTGSNAVRVDRAGVDRFWAVPNLPPQSRRYLTVSWDMRVEDAGLQSGFGPFFGVTSFDDGGGPLAQVATLGVDATTSDILVQEGGSGEMFETGFAATPGTWLQYLLVLDFATDTYLAVVGDQAVATQPFVDHTLGIDSITDADIATFALAVDSESQQAAGTAYFDNFVVREVLTGDFNQDGVVNAADYPVWRGQLGATGYGFAADADFDGDVDADDLDSWRANYAAADPAPASAVPEPTAAGLLLIAVGRLVIRRSG